MQVYYNNNYFHATLVFPFQNVLMVKAPPLPQMLKHLNREIRALVIVTTGKSELMSKPLNFTYLPDSEFFFCFF